MRVRELGDGRSVRRPSYDEAQLSVEPMSLDGDFEHELVRFEDGAEVEVTGEGSLSESVLARVDLTGSRLGPLSLTDVLFEQVELNNVVLGEVTMRAVELIRCRGMGLRLDVDLAADVFVDGCRFDYASLRLARVKGPVGFRGCTFREATIGGDLSGVVFQECDFAAAEFEATAAKDCDLRSSRLVGAAGLLTLRGARISPDQAVSVADRLAAEAGIRVAD